MLGHVYARVPTVLTFFACVFFPSFCQILSSTQIAITKVYKYDDPNTWAPEPGPLKVVAINTGAGRLSLSPEVRARICPLAVVGAVEHVLRFASPYDDCSCCCCTMSWLLSADALLAFVCFLVVCCPNSCMYITMMCVCVFRGVHFVWWLRIRRECCSNFYSLFKRLLGGFHSVLL